MAKDLEFREYAQNVKDADGDEHPVKVNAAEVTDDHNGREVPTRVGVQVVRPGDFVVATDRPEIFEVYSGQSWKDAGWTGEKQESSEVQEDKGTDRGPSGGTDKTDANPSATQRGTGQPKR